MIRIIGGWNADRTRKKQTRGGALKTTSFKKKVANNINMMYTSDMKKYGFTLTDVAKRILASVHSEGFIKGFFGQRPQSDNTPQSAFTLAEVLITLAIIGVVASLTIPLLSHAIQKNILKNQLKRTYSLCLELFNRANNDDTIKKPMGLGSGYKQFNDFIIAQLNISKVCEKNALEKGCIPEYEGLSHNIEGGCPAFTADRINNNQDIYVLTNGMIFILYHPDWRSFWLVDINGLKGPNKAGYDLFQVAFDSKKMSMSGTGCINTTPPIKGSLSWDINSIADINRW